MWNWSLFFLQMRTSSLHKFLQSFWNRSTWMRVDVFWITTGKQYGWLFSVSKQHNLNSVHNSMCTCTVRNTNVLRKLALFFQMTILNQSQMELSLCSQRFTANPVWVNSHEYVRHYVQDSEWSIHPWSFYIKNGWNSFSSRAYSEQKLKNFFSPEFRKQ